MTTARRYGGDDALAAHIVDRAEAEPDVRPVAVEIARNGAPRAGATLGTIKEGMYAGVLEALRRPDDGLLKR